MARRSQRKPKNIIMGPVRARCIRCRSKTATQDGRWYWRAELHQDGHTRTIWTAWATRQECSQQLAELIARDELDKPAAAEPEVQTIQDLLECWVYAQEQRNDTGPDWKRNSRRRSLHLIEECGDVRLDRIDLLTLERYRDIRLKRGFATATVQQDLKALKAAWRWGREMGICPDKQLPKVTIKVVGVRDKTTRG